MKKLSYFLYFLIEDFLKGKRLMVIGQSEWKDYDSGKLLGTKVETVIIEDKTDYGTLGKALNLYEKMTIKVPKQIRVPVNSEITIINPEASVYGDYRNQLSVTAESVEIVNKG